MIIRISKFLISSEMKKLKEVRTQCEAMNESASELVLEKQRHIVD